MFKKQIIKLAMLGLLVFSGCKSTTPEAFMEKQCDKNRAAIKKHIADADRQTAMIAIIDDFEFQIRAIAADSQKARQRYDAALRNYNTTAGELESLQMVMGNCLGRLCAASESHSLELRKHCSAAEWKQITAHYHSLKNITFL